MEEVGAEYPNSKIIPYPFHVTKENEILALIGMCGSNALPSLRRQQLRALTLAQYVLYLPLNNRLLRAKESDG